MNPDLYLKLVDSVGFNPDRNSIHLTSDITSETVHWFNVYFNYLYTDKYKKGTIYLSCSGGDIYSTLAMIDIMRMYDSISTDTIVLGPAFSGATLLAISGTGERSMTEHSYMMFHDIYSEENKSMPASRLINESKHLTDIQEAMLRIVEKYTKLTYLDASKLLNGNIYYDAKQCFELGMIDSIKGAI